MGGAGDGGTRGRSCDGDGILATLRAAADERSERPRGECARHRDGDVARPDRDVVVERGASRRRSGVLRATAASAE